MAISITTRGTPLHTTNAGPYTMTDGGTPTANILLLAFVNISGVGEPSVSESFAGYGLTWSQVGIVNWNSNRQSTVWAALTGSSPTSTAPTYSHDEVGNGCHIIVCEVVLDSYASTALGCIRDQGGGSYAVTATGNSGTGSLTLASNPQAANDRVIAFWETATTSGITQKSGWTELEEGTYTVPNSNSEIEWYSSSFDNNPTATWIPYYWGGIGLELIAGFTFTNLGSGANPDINSTTDGTSWSNTSWTPPTSGLILAFVAVKRTSGSEAETPTISGNGLTWVSLTGETLTPMVHSVSFRMYGAVASGATTGATTVSTTSTHVACIATFIHVEGVDTSGGALAAFTQRRSQKNSSEGTNFTASLSGAPASTSRSVGGLYHGHHDNDGAPANETTTVDAAWAKFDDLGNADIGSVANQYRTSAADQDFTDTWATSSRCISIIGELKPAPTLGASSFVIPNRRVRQHLRAR